MGFWENVQKTFIDTPTEAIGGLLNPSKPKADVKDAKKAAGELQDVSQQRELESTQVVDKREAMPTRTPTVIAAPDKVESTQVDVNKAGFAGRQMDQTLAGRDAQNQALQMAQDAASGKVPSVAEMQQKKSFEEALASQYALAASSGNPMAVRQAQMNMGQLQQQSAQQAAQLRAQETAQARGEIAAVGGQIAGQDIQRMSSDQQTAINEATNILTAQGMNQEDARATAIANQSANLQTAIAQGNITSQEGQQNLDNWLRLQGLNDNMVINLKQQALTGQISAADILKNISALKSGAGIAGAQQQVQQNAGIMSGLATAAAAYLGKSDKNAKENIKPGKGRDWVRALGSHEYNYKKDHGEDPSTRHVGVMAQDIEKTRPDMVSEDSMGDKVVNYGKGFGAMLATMFELDRDLKELEDSFKKRAKKKGA
jgi:hypothetical protein